MAKPGVPEPGLPLGQYLLGVKTTGTMCMSCGEFWPYEQRVCNYCHEYKSLVPAIERLCGHTAPQEAMGSACDQCEDLH